MRRTFWLPAALMTLVIWAGAAFNSADAWRVPAKQKAAPSTIADDVAAYDAQNDFVQTMITEDKQMLSRLNQSLVHIARPDLRSTMLDLIDSYHKELAQLQKWQAQRTVSSLNPAATMPQPASEDLSDSEIAALANGTGKRYDTALVDWVISHEEHMLRESQDFLQHGHPMDLTEMLKHIIKSRQKQIAALKYTDGLSALNSHPKAGARQ